MSDGRVVLVDTSYLVALLDLRDALHDRAIEVTKDLTATGAHLLTADVVCLELLGYFARSPLRGEAAGWLEVIRAAAGWEVLPVDRPGLLRAEDRYRRHGDKAWSLTDCFLMEILDERDLSEVATSDRHFEQAGYQALLR